MLCIFFLTLLLSQHFGWQTDFQFNLLGAFAFEVMIHESCEMIGDCSRDCRSDILGSFQEDFILEFLCFEIGKAKVGGGGARDVRWKKCAIFNSIAQIFEK